MMFWTLARVTFSAAKIVSCNKNVFFHGLPSTLLQLFYFFFFFFFFFCDFPFLFVTQPLGHGAHKSQRSINNVLDCHSVFPN
jgi:hypothetical protein